jgi:hypothetical protein
MLFFGTDFKKRSIWQGSVEKPDAKDFVVREACTIAWNKVSGTSWNVIRCEERLRNHPAAVFDKATINLICKVRNPFTIPVPSCTAFT